MEREEQPIVDAMFRALHALGRGTIKRVTEGLGWPPRSMYKYASRGLRLRELIAILRVAEISPRWFFSAVFGTVTATERFLAEGRALETAKRDLLPPAPGEPRMPDRLSHEELRQVDDLANVDPRAAAGFAARLARRAVEEGRGGDAAALVVRQGWALRILMDYHGAHACLSWGLARLEPGAQWADGMIRAAYLVSDYAAFGDAFEIAGEVIVARAHEGDLAGVARGLIARSAALYRLGRPGEAIRGLETAVSYVLDDRAHGRILYAAYQSRASMLIASGELDRAERALRRAATQEIPPGIPAAKLHWLRARIAAGRDDYEAAIDSYRQAIQGLKPSLGDVALVSCELAEVLRGANRHRQAVELCKSIAPFVRTTANPILDAALASLVRSALQGRLEKSLIERTIEKVRQARSPCRPAVLNRSQRKAGRAKPG